MTQVTVESDEFDLQVEQGILSEYEAQLLREGKSIRPKVPEIKKPTTFKVVNNWNKFLSK